MSVYIPWQKIDRRIKSIEKLGAFSLARRVAVSAGSQRRYETAPVERLAGCRDERRGGVELTIQPRREARRRRRRCSSYVEVEVGRTAHGAVPEEVLILQAIAHRPQREGPPGVPRVCHPRLHLYILLQKTLRKISADPRPPQRRRRFSVGGPPSPEGDTEERLPRRGWHERTAAAAPRTGLLG